ncbi:WYL domain-containing protein [Ancylobacter sp. IITR112]|uniref:WYL domain-containing protein n=1 Tax=Ancylobacter sp. IITR112 TaxID=3138073 RepID=UPI00352A417A
MGLLDWFGAKGAPEEPWRKFARADIVEVTNADTGEMIEINPGNDDPTDAEGLFISFDYVDSQGQWTSRDVLCHQVFWNGGGVYVRGLCTMRESMRTFRVDRMESVRELRSGHLVSDHIAFFDKLAIYNEDAFDRRPAKAAKPKVDYSARHEARVAHRARAEEARDATLPGLKILAYLSLLDGGRSEAEARIEVAYVRERLAGVGLDGDADLVAEMAFLAQGLTPTRRSYVQAVGKIARDDDNLALIGRYALELARHDGAVDAVEREALNLLLATARKKRA